MIGSIVEANGVAALEDLAVDRELLIAYSCTLN